MDKLTDRINALYGMVIALLTAIFGTYWFLFAGFLALNIVDYFTGIIKAKYFGKNESSKTGAKGALKKVSYWVVIGVAFFMAISLAKMGELLKIDLEFVILFGWFTLAAYIINEIRSVLENVTQMGIKVPAFLITGLEVAEGAIEKMNGGEKNE